MPSVKHGGGGIMVWGLYCKMLRPFGENSWENEP